MVSKISFKVPPPLSLPCTLNKIQEEDGENKNDSKLMVANAR